MLWYLVLGFGPGPVVHGGTKGRGCWGGHVVVPSLPTAWPPWGDEGLSVCGGPLKLGLGAGPCQCGGLGGPWWSLVQVLPGPGRPGLVVWCAGVGWGWG